MKCFAKNENRNLQMSLTWSVLWKNPVFGFSHIYRDNTSEQSEWLIYTLGRTYLNKFEMKLRIVLYLRLCPMSYKPNNKLLEIYVGYSFDFYIAPGSHFPKYMSRRYSKEKTRTKIQFFILFLSRQYLSQSWIWKNFR